MSTVIPGQRIPDLNEEIVVGTGRFSRGLKLRESSGTESGPWLLDFELLHVITTIDDARQVEKSIAGAEKAFARAYGEASDGSRTGEWKPEKPDCTIILCAAGGGVKAYEGAAEVRRAVIRVRPKACVVTIFCRLHATEEGNLVPIGRLLGKATDYEWRSTSLEGAMGKGDQGPLFAKGGEGKPTVGDLVVLNDERVLLVTAVGEDGSVTGSRLLDGSDLSTATPDQVFDVVRLCGAKGGPAKNPTRKLRDRAEADGLPDLTAEELQRGIVEASDRGLIKLGADGYPLTTEVGDLVVELTRDAREPDPE